MSLTFFFGLLGALLVLAYLANRFSRRTRVPDVLVLLLTGVLLGPVLHLVNANQFRDAARGFGTLALMLILFEGGLDLDIREALKQFPGGLLLGLLSYGFSLGLTMVVAHYSLAKPWDQALLIGAVLGCVSSSVLLSVLQQIEISRPLRVTLTAEAAFADALGVLVVDALVHLGDASPILPGMAASFLVKLGIALLVAVPVGALWSRLVPRFSEQRFWNVLTFAAMLLVYAFSELAGGNPLFAVLAFGLAIANFPGESAQALESAYRSWASAEAHQQMLTFHAELGFLIRTFFFVLLGVLVDFVQLRHIVLAALGIFGACFLARWLAVQASAWSWRGVEKRERELAVWLLPRGLITAVLAFEVMTSSAGANFPNLIGLAFGVILLTNLLVLFAAARARSVAPALVPAPAAGAPPSA